MNKSKKQANYLKISFYVWIIFTLLGTTLVVIFNSGPTLENYISIQIPKNVSFSNNGLLINTNSCKIPNLPVLSESIKKFMKEKDGVTPPKCKNDPPLIKSDSMKLYFNYDSFKHYSIKKPKLLSCCYEELIREEPKEGEIDRQYKLSKECKFFTNAVTIEKEFIHVKCIYKNNSIYNDMFSFIPIKYNMNTINNPKEMLKVLIIGLDGVSRLNFHRQMPKTASFLRNASFIEFLGYNKVADNTFPNIIPVLTGKTGQDVEEDCYNKTFFDKCPFIWKLYKEKNYVTSFGEDTSWMGIFNYLRNGFQKQPTDYYWSFFNRISELKYGNMPLGNVKECIGPREQYKIFLDYIKNFVYRLTSYNIPYFGFYWGAALTHDYFNAARRGDDYYLKFFEDLYNKNYFENTITIFMSDHGIRYGGMRSTFQGRLEERLPFLFIRLPPSFRLKYPGETSNLISNTKQLTTPFDLHETLNHIITMDSSYENRSLVGISLFKKIPPQRTCQDAGISAHWCTCQEATAVKVDEKIVNFAKYVANYMNKLLNGFAQCAHLSLNKTLNAQKLHHKGDISEGSGHFEDYLISFVTEPGGGAFEATIRNHSNGEEEIVGTISRLNLYGEQSSCILDFHLKLYCYCI